MNSPALTAWLERLSSFSPHEIELGLDRAAAVYARLGSPRPPHVLTVGGTNGKGSSVAFASELLRAAGYSVGAYTSPHIHIYNERVRIDDRYASDAELVSAFERVEIAREQTPLTYFEYATLAALVVFSNAGVDVAVLEVGLGGRLDAVNIVDSDAAIVTNVSLDHCDWLGDTLALIAREKAGIYRSGRPALFGDDSVPETLRAHADMIGADLLIAGRDFRWGHTASGWFWQGRTQRLDELPRPSLAGEYQLRNAAGALALIEAAGLDKALEASSAPGALGRVSVPGRMQRVVHRELEWTFDVAHNPAASQALSLTLEKPAGERIAIIGMLSDKDLDGAILPLCPLVDRWIAMTPENPRAVPAAELARHVSNLSNRPCLIAASVDDAVAAAMQQTSNDDRILVTGSFFTVGPVQRALGLYSPSSQA